VSYHFVDLKGCKLPTARPDDHHSVIIKKALVMKVITLGMSAPALPAIESASLIVPSIRFSSQMSAAPKVASAPEPARRPAQEFPVEAPQRVPVEMPEEVPAVPREPEALTEPEPELVPALSAVDDSTLFEMDSTLTNLARVAQELTQKKLAAIERDAALEQWQSRLQQQQSELDEQTRALEQRTTQLHDQSLAVSQRAEALKALASKVSGMRQGLRSMLLELDQALDG
jgi:hypothetical protein